MPSLDVPIPSYPREHDLYDATDAVDRSEFSAEGMTALIIAWLQKVSAAGADKYSMPAHVSAANRGTYEGNIDDALTAAATLAAKLKANRLLT